jgi:hypothetical protein
MVAGFFGTDEKRQVPFRLQAAAFLPPRANPLVYSTRRRGDGLTGSNLDHRWASTRYLCSLVLLLLFDNDRLQECEAGIQYML